MGCLCSKGPNASDSGAENEKQKEDKFIKSPVEVMSPLKRDEVRDGENGGGGPLHLRTKKKLEPNASCMSISEDAKTIIIERPKNGHRRHSTMDLGNVNVRTMSKITSMSHVAKAEQVAAGWPPWLASVASEAIRGWSPRSADSFEKLHKIGQGTYSSVYMARDLKTEKIVAMKKVRFVNMDPESVRFMAREICILRRLDHPNCMKLEALVTSRVSGSFYLVFEYMEHDLAGLLASPKVKFTEPQIKCYMKQLLSGLEHCHSRGVLHRDIKGSNLLVDNKGVLKIADFGLATTFQPGQREPLTSRVVTLWYRAPELLLGTTQYGAAIDLWSAGCILAELFAGKPIMPGRTEVEQMHKIFKLCGSPTEEFWNKTKLPHASSFKSYRSYKSRIADTFKDFPSSALALTEVLLSIDPEERGTASSALKTEFFTTDPLPCDPSRIPRYPPSKEFDAKIRDKEAKRQRDESLKGGAENNTSRQNAPPEGQGSSTCISYKYNPQEASRAGFPIEPPRAHLKDSYPQMNTVQHPQAAGYSKMKYDPSGSVQPRMLGTSQHPVTRQCSQVRQPMIDSTHYHAKNIGGAANNDMVFAPKKNRIIHSGPLMPPGGNLDDMLKEHERHIQEAMRKANQQKIGV